MSQATNFGTYIHNYPKSSLSTILEINDDSVRHNKYMANLNLNETEVKVLIDSIANNRLSIEPDQEKNPELKEYLSILDNLETKLVAA